MRAVVSALSMVLMLCGLAMAQQSPIVGQWQATQGQYTAVAVFGADGSYQFMMQGPEGQQGGVGRYTIQGNQIQVTFQNGMQQMMTYQINGNDLIVGMNGQQMQFTRSGGQAGGPGQMPPGQQQGIPGQQQGNPGQIPPGQQGGMQQGGMQQSGGMQTHQHPMGFTFQAPAGWQPQANNNLIVLTPGDAFMTNQGPAEGVFVWAEQAQGIINALDPQVFQYLGQQVTQTFPYMQAAGNGQPFGNGAVYSFQGTSPLNIAMVGRLYVVMNNGMAYVTLGLCPQERLGQRDPQFQQIIGSMPGGGGGQMNPPGGVRPMPGGQGQTMPGGQGQQQGIPGQQGGMQQGGPGQQMGGPAQGGGQIDAQLVGFWTYVEESNFNGGYTAVTRGLMLQQNQTYAMGSKMQASGSTSTSDTSGQNDWSIEDEGTWMVQGQTLILRSNSGQEMRLQYQFGGNGVIFTDAQGQQYNCKRDQM